VRAISPAKIDCRAGVCRIERVTKTFGREHPARDASHARDDRGVLTGIAVDRLGIEGVQLRRAGDREQRVSEADVAAACRHGTCEQVIADQVIIGKAALRGREPLAAEQEGVLARSRQVAHVSWLPHGE
jgi:hypothetical protein